MRDAQIAEWLLRRLTSKARAAAMVGDLLETGSKMGRLRFWAAVTGLSFALSSRRVLAFIAAFYAFGWTFNAYMMITNGAHTAHRPLYLYQPVFSVLGSTGAFLWLAAAYLSIRFGFGDRFAQYAFACAAVIAAVIMYWWQPVVLTVTLVTAAFSLVYFMRTGEHRRAALALPTVPITGICVGLSFGYILSVYQEHLHHGSWGDWDLRRYWWVTG